MMGDDRYLTDEDRAIMRTLAVAHADGGEEAPNGND